MSKSTGIRVSTVAYILRQHADQLYKSLAELLGADDDLELEELTREQEQELMLFVVSLIRGVAAESRQMIPYLSEVATFGTENFAEITKYVDARSAGELQQLMDARLRQYLDVLVVLSSSDSVNIDAALRRFADMADADTDLRKRVTAIGTQRFLMRQITDFRESLTAIEARATAVEEQAREWLGQRARAPDGHERAYDSFADPSIGLHISPRRQRWNPDKLDTPLRWVVLKMEDEFEPKQEPVSVSHDSSADYNDNRFAWPEDSKSIFNNNIVIEDVITNFTWELTRKDEVKKVNGAVLAVLVSVALENGWRPPSGAKATSNIIDLQLLDQLPEYFDAQESKSFCSGAMKSLLKQDSKKFGPEEAAFLDLLNFINQGNFQLKKIIPRLNCLILNVPDDDSSTGRCLNPSLPESLIMQPLTPVVKMRVMSLEGEGVFVVNLPDSIIDRWGSLEGTEIYLHAIIPDEIRHKEVFVLEKSAWEKASQVLRYFAESSDDVYMDQFKKVLNQILHKDEYEKVIIPD
jgi:hypothetical protein